MDFKSLGENSPVYIIRKKPFSFETGTLKSKGLKPQNQMNPFMPQTTPQTIDVVISVGGSDETLPSIPVNMEVVEYKNSFYSTTPEGAQQAVANMMQFSKSRLEERAYDESVLSEGERVMEKLNPQYAEGKRQARTIEELQSHQEAQDKKLDSIIKMLEKISPSPKT
jgi:hypothetical protein